MKTKPQMISVEPTTRMPAWRSVSPKKRNARNRKTSPTIFEQNLTISPNASTQPRGMAIRSSISALPRDRHDLGMGCQQHLRKGVVERKDPHERDHHRLIDGAADPFGTARRGHALVTADDRDDRAEQGGLQYRAPQVGGVGVVEQGREERSDRSVVDQRGQDPAEDPE